MFNIEMISQEEHDIIKRAQENYGFLLDIAIDVLKLSWTFPKVLQIDAWVFAGFLSQSNNALYLYLLSTLRKHAAQSNFNARLSIEASIMACYALKQTDINTFIEKDSLDKPRAKQNAKSKANKWIESHYKEHSDRLREIKSEINQTFAHSNIVSAFGHFELSEANKQSYTWFFDLTLDRDVHFQLLKFIDLVLAQIAMYKDVVSDYPLLHFRDDFEPDYDKTLTMYAALSDYYKGIAQEIEKGNIEDIPIFQIIQDEETQ
ncbi:hypothetical protein [Saccharibacillus deserti]|uniref:hypothetical protein n=1 Tax=Saccharibacillus deserti TaxID=1634444 RepID=UPI00155262F0|nr:hypothetical protein [Saccharibacillus deserti]